MRQVLPWLATAFLVGWLGLAATIGVANQTAAEASEPAALASDTWRRLQNAEANPVLAKPEEITEILVSCRALADRQCEARALVVQAELVTQMVPTEDAAEAATAALSILRGARPTPELGRALLLARPVGAEDDAEAIDRVEEVLALAAQIDDPVLEGRALCERARLDAAAGRLDAARESVARLKGIESALTNPRVSACRAYVEGLVLYDAGARERGREVWDAHLEAADAAGAPRETLWLLIRRTLDSIHELDAERAVARARQGVALADRLSGSYDRARAYCNLASSVSIAGLDDERGPAAQSCLDWSRRAGFREGEAVALKRLGDAMYHDGQSARALELYEQSLVVFRAIGNLWESGWILERMGNLLLDLGEAEEARRVMEEMDRIARKLDSLPMRLSVSANLSRLLSFTGEPEAGLRVANEGLRLLPDEGSAFFRAMLHRVRGMARERLHNLSGALEDYRRALELFEAGGIVHFQAWVVNDIGIIQFYLNRLDRSLAYFEQAHALGRQSGHGIVEAEALWNITMLKRQSGVTRQDRTFLVDAAIKLAARGGPDEINNLCVLSRVLMTLGEPQEAERTARLALDKAIRQGIVGLEALARVQLASVLSGLERPGEAIAQCRRALDATATPSTRMEACWRCGNILRLSGQPEEAALLLESGLELAEATRSRLTQPDLRALFFADKSPLFADLVGALLEAAGPDPRPETIARTFAISERFRARVLLEALGAGGRPEGSGDTTSDVSPSRRSELLARMAKLHLRYAGGSTSDAEQFMVAIREVEEQLEETAPADSPAPGSQLIGETPLALEALRRELLDPSTAGVEYLLGQGNSYLFVVTTRTSGVVTLPRGRRELESRVRRFRGLLERRTSQPERDRAAILQMGAALYRDLIEPALERVGDDVTRLVIAPDGPLHLLPFEALVVSREDDSGAPRYLVENFEIAYVPSFSVLSELRTRPEPVASRGSLAACANPRLPRSHDAPDTVFPSHLPPLPYSEDEVRNVASRLGGQQRVLRGPAATEAGVRESLEAGYRVVHLATHGFLDAGSTGRSGVVLTPEPGIGDDGLLQAREVVDLRVNSSLVVLSGCSTGRGKVVAGEGLLGLPHALFQAGAPSIVMSLWQVRDRAAAVFMDRFYRGLADGLPVGRALRAAKLELIESGREDLAHPSVWAPFVLAGLYDRSIAASATHGKSTTGPLKWTAGLLALAAVLWLAAIATRRARSRSGRLLSC